MRGGGGEIDAYVDMLVAQIAELEDSYQSIYIIGHSLGGVMAEAATMKYLTYRASDISTPLTPICGLLLFASPRAGAALALPGIRNLFEEGKWLHRGSLQNRETDEYFSTKIQSDASAEIDRSKKFIPRYVCRGVGDRIIDSFSALNSIPGDQRLLLSANHRSIVKPSNSNAEQIRWVNEKITFVEACRQRFRETQLSDSRIGMAIISPPPVLVTELWTRGSDGSKWVQVYNEVRASVAPPDPEVHDRRDVSDANVDLLMSLADSDLIITDGTANNSEIVDRVLARKESNMDLTVGLSAVGGKSAEATQLIGRWLHEGSWPPDVFVDEANDIDHLRSVMSTWIYNIIRRNPRLARIKEPQAEHLIKMNFGQADV